MKEYFDIAAYGDECKAEDRWVREDIQNEIKRMLDLNKFPVVKRAGASPHQSLGEADNEAGCLWAGARC
jgi:hypothetical protein